ncbi:imm11 family protein [Psychromonas sp. PT13]|uniref:imm11 family protein n=1 Tax=Psychromonas sp. PT13 TaxID=3439547 RepID=UPI003EB7484F
MSGSIRPEYSLSIVSKEFKDTLSSYSTFLEFVPVSILCGENEFLFYALHVMLYLDAFDIDKSVFVGVKYGMVSGITQLVLKESVIKNENVFALKNAFMPIIIIDESIRLKVKQLGLKGITFVPANEYQEDIRGI